MHPKELFERLTMLSISGGSLQTVLIAPQNMAYARSWIDDMNSGDTRPHDLRNYEGQVTSQDLQEFLRSISLHENKG
jgi:hypothetical protein